MIPRAYDHFIGEMGEEESKERTESKTSLLDEIKGMGRRGDLIDYDRRIINIIITCCGHWHGAQLACV